MFSVFGLVKIEILNKDGMSHSCEIIILILRIIIIKIIIIIIMIIMIIIIINNKLTATTLRKI